MESSSYLVIEDNKRLNLYPNENDFLIDESTGYKIEHIRKLKSWAVIKPFNARIKFALISKVEKMSLDGQNTILKTLEEPPTNTFVVLTTSNKTLILPTILSRCAEISIDKFISFVADSIDTKHPFFIAENTTSVTPSFPQFTSISEAMKEAEKFAKKYTRDELKVITEEWSLALAEQGDIVDIKSADLLLTAREHLSHNTNLQLTLEVCFLSIIESR